MDVLRAISLLQLTEFMQASLHAEQKFTNDHNHIEDQIRKLQAKREAILSGNGLANLEFDETIGASPSDDSSNK